MIGLIVGVLNVIPYVGPTIGIAIGIFIGVTGMQGDVSTGGMALRIAGTILFAQGVDNFVLQPVLYSNRAKSAPAGDLPGNPDRRIAGRRAGYVTGYPAYNVIRVFAKEFFNNFRVVQKLTEKI